jgi:phosphoglycolate phosphatase
MENFMLPSFDAILFDFDGTLAIPNLDFADMRRQLNAFTAAHGVEVDDLAHLDMLALMDTAMAWLNRRGGEHGNAYYRQADSLLQDIEIASAQRGALLPGILELLDALRLRDISIGIVTRNCEPAVRIIFPDVDAYCRALYAREHVEQVKPHPAHLQAALSHLGVASDRALMVGDGAMDMEAGKRLGLFAIGVLSGETPRERLLAHGADLILDSAADLLHQLPSLTGPSA